MILQSLFLVLIKRSNMKKTGLILLIIFFVSCKNNSKLSKEMELEDSTIQSISDSNNSSIEEPEPISFDTFKNISENNKLKTEYIRRMKGINSGLRDLDASIQKVFWNNQDWSITIKKDSHPIKAYVNDEETETYDQILELYYWKGKLFLSYYQNHYYLFEKQNIVGVLDSAFQIKEVISIQSVNETNQQFIELDSLIMAPFKEIEKQKN